MLHVSEIETRAAGQACATHCPYCALQCGMHVQVTAQQSWTVTERDFPTNRGGLCQKGWTSGELLGHADRLRTPLIRDSRTAPLRTATWDEALARIISAIEQTQHKYGRDGVGIFGGGSLTNEKAYLLGKFARVALRTSQIDYNGRFCMSSAAAASIKAFGLDRGLPFPLADIAQTQAILLVGSNLAETMPPVMQYFQEQKARGGSLIVVDPRATATAAASTLHLQITPGTDAALANGLLNIAIKEGYIDETFISTRTRDFELVRRIASSYWPDRVERITGVSEQQIQLAARIL
ncbi:MAG TPA: molybdopterin-dependent oxidoreductase, partial [Bryobacteraceae bacterium]|nr:molybdopterin-dependent oxidoreductase [Bryobacteraceae bacterium]